MSYKQLLSDYLDGTCFNAYTYFGAHPETRDQVAGWVFRVWAPHATKVQVAGGNEWLERRYGRNGTDYPLRSL